MNPSLSRQPFVSVIIPAYNAEQSLRACIASLGAQTYTHWEAIIVDDGSTDSTPDVLAELASHEPRLRVYRQHNQRQAAARNHALDMAGGELIALLDADDVALPDRFSKQVAFFLGHPDVMVLGGASIQVDALTGQAVGLLTHPSDHETLCRKIFTQCPFSTSTVMARAEFFRSWRFIPETTPCEDHDLWLRSYQAEGVRFHNLEEPLVRYSCRSYMSWYHYRQIARMYARALRREGRWPRDVWYSLRPLLAALRFNPFARR